MKLHPLLASIFAASVADVAAKPFIQESKQPEQNARPPFNFKRMAEGGPSKHLRPVIERRGESDELPIIGSSGPDTTVEGYFDGDGEYSDGQPLGKDEKGATIVGGTNKIIDVQNPSNLGQETTDNGNVVNLKWRFSDSHTERYKGGWAREQVISDLPSSIDISGAQQHLKKGAFRVVHWHRAAEWAFVYAGRVAITAVNELGQNQYTELGVGDIWFFPKGVAHGVQGLDDDNEFLLVFDKPAFDAVGTTFNVDDWIAHTPKDILAKNFGFNISAFEDEYAKKSFPKILEGELFEEGVDHPYGDLAADPNITYVIRHTDVEPIVAPGGGGTIQIFDSKSFPISTTIAASVVRIKPGGLRELHWHPTATEWVYFAQGQARATVFMGTQQARTFDFAAGDTAVFPDNSGHYVENTSDTEELVWIEIFKADHVADISLTQWLALTPAPLVAQTLNVSVEVARGLKKEKQLIIA